MISERLQALLQCPDCRASLERAPDGLACPRCGRQFDVSGGYVDLRPSDRFAEQTRYLDAALHVEARHETVAPPLLSAAVRNRMLRSFLSPAPADRVIDLGCGSGRVLCWNRDQGWYQVGVDVSPFFAPEAQNQIDLTLGDLRRLPFSDGVFNKAYALDVFEHLSREGLAAVLAEAARVLEPGGVLFAYSHVRKNSRLASGLRAINRLARGLERLGVLDLSHERLRKSDHVNPISDIPDLERVTAAAGFRIARIRYYTPLIGGFIENILVRSVDQLMARRTAASGPGVGTERTPSFDGGAEGADGRVAGDRAGALRAARTAARRRLAQRGPVYAVLRTLTAIMMLDVLLWGRIKSGPFFALLVQEKRGGTAEPCPLESTGR